MTKCEDCGKEMDYVAMKCDECLKECSEDEELICHYPGCKKKATKSSSQKLTNKKESSVELPFCNYHWLIVIGGHFTATEKKGKFVLNGPFKEIEYSEQVFAAIQLTKKK